MLDTLRSVLRFRRFELDSVERRLATAANVDDLRRHRQAPACPPACSITSTAAPRTSVAMRANRDAFGRYEFSPTGAP